MAGSAAAPAARCRNCLRWGSFMATTPLSPFSKDRASQYGKEIAAVQYLHWTASVRRLRARRAVQTAVDEPGEGRRPGENGDDHEQVRQRQQERRRQDPCQVV